MRIKYLFFRVLFLLYLIQILATGTLLATKYYSRATGNWNSTSSWSTTAFNGSAAANYPGQLSANDTAYISMYTITADVTPANSIKFISLTQTNTFSNADTRLLISTAGITLTCAAFSMTDNNLDYHMDLQVSASAIFQVNGNATVTRSSANTRDKRILVNILNTARMNVTGNFTYTFGRAGIGNAQGNEIQLDNSGRLDISGTLSMTIGNNSGSNNPLDLVLNNSAVLNVATVSQSVTATNDGDDILMHLNGGTFTVTGTWTSTVTTTAAGSSSVTLYIDGATLSTGNFTFQQSGGGTGDMSIFMNQTSTAGAALLTVNGNLLFNHDDGDNMEIETNPNTTVNVTGKFSSYITTPSNGDIVILDLNGGSFNIADSLYAQMNSNTNYYEVLIDGAALTARGISFNQGGTGTGDMYIYMNNSSTAVAATLTVGNYGLNFYDNGGDNMDIELHANSSVTINGNMSFNNNAASGNDRNMLKTYTGSPAPSFTINGNFTGNMNTGTNSYDQIFFDINNGTFNCTGSMTFTTAAVCALGSNCMIEIDGNSTTFTVGGSVTLNHLGGTGSTANDYIYMGINSGSPSLTAGSLSLNGQGGNATRFKMNNSSTATINGNVTLAAAAAGNVILDLNGSSVFQLKGNFVRSATPNRFGSLSTATNAVVKYIGTANSQVIAGDAGSGGDGFAYHDVVINNTYSVSPQLTMNSTEGNATIPNGATLTFTSGVVSSSSSSMFVIADGGTTTQGNASSYVDGPIKKVGDSPTSYIFPVGNGNVWARLGISSYSGFSGSTEFTCQYYYTAAPNNSPGYMGSTVGPRLDHVSYVEYWDFNRAYDPTNNASCQVTLYWEDSLRSKIRNLPDLRVAQFQTAGTGQWENQGQSGATQSGSTGSITSSVRIADFIPITFGSWQGLNPLPVELLYFTPVLNDNNTVLLKWETASQINNDYFTVERSSDGMSFEELKRIEGAGNSSQILRYTTNDSHPFEGINFYRLKQTDYNGGVFYSEIKSIKTNKDNKDIFVKIYPNPATNRINIVFDKSERGEKEILLSDVFGKIIFEMASFDQYITIASDELPEGIYFLRIYSSIQERVKKVRIVH